MCLSVPYFPLIHAPVHYSRERRSTPLISRLRTKSTTVSPSVLHPRYLYLSVPVPGYYIYHTIPPPPCSLSCRPLCRIFAVFLPRYTHPLLSVSLAECSLSLLPDARIISSLSVFFFLFLLEIVFCRLSRSLSLFRVSPASRGL